MARLPWAHLGSIGLSHGALTGSPHTRMRHPVLARRTRRLCRSTHSRTRLLTCQAALSQTGTTPFSPPPASCARPRPRNSSVVALANPYGTWPRTGKGKTPEDAAVLKWMHTDAKDK